MAADHTKRQLAPAATFWNPLLLVCCNEFGDEAEFYFPESHCILGVFMARSVNRVTMLGNLTKDVEVKFTPSNIAVGNFGIALNREWKTPDGQTREEVTFVDCEAWGKTAELLQKYTKKGSKIYLEGRLKLDTWKDKTDGSNRSKLKVVVEEFTFLDSKSSGPGGGPGASSEQPGGYASEESSGGGGGYSSEPSARSSRPAAPAAAQVSEADIPF